MYLEDILLPIVLLLLLVYSVSDVDQVVISPFSVIQDIGTEMNAYCECSWTNGVQMKISDIIYK